MSSSTRVLGVPTTEVTQSFVGVPDPEPTLGGLIPSKTGLGGDPAVLVWLAGVTASGRVW